MKHTRIINCVFSSFSTFSLVPYFVLRQLNSFTYKKTEPEGNFELVFYGS